MRKSKFEDKKILYIKALKGRGEVYMLVGEFEKSIKDFKKMREISQRPLIKSQSLYKCAQVEEMRGRLKESLNYVNKALKIAEKENLLSEKVKILTLKSLLFIRKGEFTKSKKISEYIIKNLKKIKKNIGSYEIIAEGYKIMGTYFYRIGDYKNALHWYYKSLKILKNSGNKVSFLNVLNAIAGVYFYKGKYKKALEIYYECLRIATKIQNKYALAFLYNNLGGVKLHQEKYNEALKLFYKSLEIEKKMGNKRGMSRAIHNIGIIYNLKGNYGKAIKYFESAGFLKKEIKDLWGYAIVLTNIAYLYYLSGALKKALKYYKRGLRLYENLNSIDGIMEVLVFITKISLLTGKKIDIEKLEEIEEISKKMQNWNTLVQILLVKGDYFFQQGKINKALKLYKESFKISTSINSTVLIAQSKSGIVKCLIKMDIKNKEYINHIKDIRTMCKKINNPETLYYLYECELHYYLKMQKYDKAEKCILKMKNIVYKNRLKLFYPSILYFSSLIAFGKGKEFKKDLTKAIKLSKIMGLVPFLREIENLKKYSFNYFNF